MVNILWYNILFIPLEAQSYNDTYKNCVSTSHKWQLCNLIFDSFQAAHYLFHNKPNYSKSFLHLFPLTQNIQFNTYKVAKSHVLISASLLIILGI